jgi:uncharacterized protein YabE (DUF348 family)
MRLIIHKSTTIWGTGIVVGLLLLISLFALIHGRADAQSGSGGRLITIHDRGQEKVLLSDAVTVGDALKAAGVTIDSHDAVEPAATEKLVASEYQVNIYRARPVMVIDGGIRQKIVTAYQTAEQIVKDAGITLYPEDTTKLSQSDNILADGAGLALTIDRATAFNFTLYGTTSVARTQTTTVGAMLKEKKVTLGVNDRVSVPLTTPITTGVAVQVWREGKQTITVEEPVAFDTQQIKDADREIGYKAVQTPGVNGKQNVTYEVDIRDGQEVGRTKIASLVTTEPSKQVEIIGAKSRFLPYIGGGSKTEWLSQSTVPSESWGIADFIVGRESGWNPNAMNSHSGACGLAQALPCSKVPGNPYNPIDSLNWMNGYVNGRYGGWLGAYNYWNTHGNY